MKFNKRISRLLAKFMLASTTVSCFGCRASAMEVKELTDLESTKITCLAYSHLKCASSTVVRSAEFRKLVRNYIDQEYKTKFMTLLPLEQKGYQMALDILDHKFDNVDANAPDTFISFLPGFAEYYVKDIMTKQGQK